MKPAPFEYLAPESLSSTLEILAEHGDEAKLLAGGQSLIPAMNFRLVQPTVLVDLNRLSDLSYIKRGNSGDLLIGSMARHRQLEFDSQVREHAALIHETMPYIAHPQIRNRGTIGGSLAHADPAAELPVLLVALGGRVRLKNLSGERWVEARDFFEGIFTTALGDDEIIIEILIPKSPFGTGHSFVEFARRKGDYALLGIAVLLTLDANAVCQQARIVYLNAGETPVMAEAAASLLLNEKRSEKLLEAAAMDAEKELSLTGNIHASVPYLRHLSRVLTIRALNQAFDRAYQLMREQ